MLTSNVGDVYINEYYELSGSFLMTVTRINHE